MNTTEKKSKYAGISPFKLGWSQLNIHEKEIITTKIMNELGIKTKSSFDKIRCYGIGKLRAKQDISVVEAAFAEVGIPAEDIWDKPEEIENIKNQ